ncbi:MAG: alpha/beta fold hydrolase [Candidatus Gastranaerophilales bacterium]|nr:alpha/beta fold hydrolase [Candidatus Gastranaerophilales bacterium]
MYNILPTLNEMSTIKLSMIILFIGVIFGLQLVQPVLAFGNLERDLIYYPMDKKLADVRLELKNNFEDTYFYTLDGVKLNAWYIKSDKDKPTIIYCHGQGENISQWQSVTQSLTDNGYGVFMLEYRGHGRSEGSPSESGLYTDLESAIKYLKEYEHIPQNNIVLWGRSLGGAVVADVASRDKFKGVILESTFTNIRQAGIHLCSTKVSEGRFKFWSKLSTTFVRFMPMTQKFDTENKVSKISSPLLIGHSINDETIPVSMGRKLAALNPDAETYISKTGSHHSSEWFKTRALEFLYSLQ